MTVFLFVLSLLNQFSKNPYNCQATDSLVKSDYKFNRILSDPFFLELNEPTTKYLDKLLKSGNDEINHKHENKELKNSFNYQNTDSLVKSDYNFNPILSHPLFLELDEQTKKYLDELLQYGNDESKESKKTNERKYKKNEYPKDDPKTKQNIPEVTEKVNNGTTNFKKYKRETYDKGKEAKSKRSRYLKNTKMQRKRYNNFYIKAERDFQNSLYKLNDKNENFINNHYNVSFIPNNTQISTIKSRLLAQTQKHNPHYHNATTQNSKK
ncbi:hypothetical protein PFFCH_05522 [Plasmodium falciparum FCH/4]|uniref:Uncharacterized protein n=1 Tax=Plasmodium falciparum FCH/4 TaxID=1036724 RepID=A0A024VE97_PLAFA|nr:hypothetical protein PFFCH_05522 [Plasmodium falciparum FCH/4]